MTEYTIRATWIMTATVTVEAANIEEAQDKASQGPLPEGEYVSDSWEIDEEASKELTAERHSGTSCDCEACITKFDPLPEVQS